MKKKKHKILKVTLEKLYLIPMFDDEITEINGWTIPQVIHDWFGENPLGNMINRTHASRDVHEIGGSKKVLHVEEDSELEI